MNKRGLPDVVFVGSEKFSKIYITLHKIRAVCYRCTLSSAAAASAEKDGRWEMGEGHTICLCSPRILFLSVTLCVEDEMHLFLLAYLLFLQSFLSTTMSVPLKAIKRITFGLCTADYITDLAVMLKYVQNLYYSFIQEFVKRPFTKLTPRRSQPSHGNAMAMPWQCKLVLLCKGPSIKYVTLEGRGSEKVWQFVSGEGVKSMWRHAYKFFIIYMKHEI